METTEFYIAQGISILTAIIAILSMQLKSMKGILITQIIANLLASSTYFVLGSFSGAGISLIAIIQLIVVYIYGLKKIKPHKLVIITFIAAYTGYTIYSIINAMQTNPNHNPFFDLFPYLAAVFFALGIIQEKPSIYRIYGMLNPLCWLVYDIYSLALINSIMRVGIFLSALIAKIRLDGFMRKKQTNNEE